MHTRHRSVFSQSELFLRSASSGLKNCHETTIREMQEGYGGYLLAFLLLFEDYWHTHAHKKISRVDKTAKINYVEL